MKKFFIAAAAFLLITGSSAANEKFLSRADAEKLNIIITYPGWKLKALTFSYDDGNIADRQLVAIFNKYNMKGTFHIPSAWLTIPKRAEKRVKESEIKTLYANHEVSGHGAKHITLTLVKPARVAQELDGDIREWQRITGKKLLGYAYPFGRFNDSVVNVLKEKGLIYSRTCRYTRSFDLTTDFLRWQPHAHHKRNIKKWGENYLRFKPVRMSLLLIWGHSYEFDKAKNWHIIENFCKQMANQPDIFYATMGEIALYATEAEKLAISADGKKLTNKSPSTIYFIYKGKKVALAPNENFYLK